MAGACAVGGFVLYGLLDALGNRHLRAPLSVFNMGR